MKTGNPNPALKWFTLLLLLSISFGLDAQQQITDPIDYIQGMLIGKGYNYYLSQISPKSPLANSDHEKQPYNGQVATPTAKVISDYTELENELELNANASFDVFFASGSVKAYFYNKAHFERNTFYILLKSEILNSYDYLTQEPQLNSEALNVLKSPSGLNNFIKIYGNTFVYGIQSGGAYYGLITIESTNMENRTQAETELRASCLIGNAALNIKLKELAKNKKITFSCEERITGGIGLGAPSLDVNDMVNKVKILASQVSAHPVPLKAQVCPYSVFLEYLNASSAFGVDRELAILQLNYNYLDYFNLKKSLNYMVVNPVFFRFKSNDQNNKIKEFKNRIKDIDANLIKINAERQSVADISKPLAPSKVESAQSFGSKILLPIMYEAPVRQLTTQVTPPPGIIYPLTKHTAGDGEIAGHRPTILLKVEIQKQPANLTTTANLHYNCVIKESKSDWTTFEDTKDETLLKKDVDFPSGLVIKTVSPETGVLSTQAGEDDHAFTSYKNGTGLVKSAACRSDTPGDEFNELGCNNIIFSPVIVNYQHIEDAKNLPITYTPASDAPIQIFIHKVPTAEKVIKMKMDLKTYRKNVQLMQLAPGN